MVVHLKTSRIDKILSQYRQAQSQLPAHLRLARLGVMQELFFNEKPLEGQDAKEMCQGAILDQEVSDLCQRIQEEYYDRRDFDDIIL